MNANSNPPGRESSPARVAELLRDKQGELIAIWQRRVLADPAIPQADSTRPPEPSRHLVALIRHLAFTLGQRASEPPAGSGAGDSDERARGLTGQFRAHGQLRFDEGYALTEAMRELSHLRRAIIEMCTRENIRLDGDVALLVHATIDDALSMAAAQMQRAAHAELRRDAEFGERFVGISRARSANAVVRHPAHRDPVAPAAHQPRCEVPRDRVAARSQFRTHGPDDQ